MDDKNALGIHCNFGRDKIDENLVNKYLDIWKANFNTIIFVSGPKKEGDKQTDKQVQHKVYAMS